MNIGRASRESGVSAKMIRYYESIGLLPEADRRESGYRDYGPPDIDRLKFVRRARDLGFSIEQIHELLALWSDTRRSDEKIRAVAAAHVIQLEAQAVKLREMIATLRHLIRACEAGDRPNCPIIIELGGAGEGPTRRRAKSRATALRN